MSVEQPPWLVVQGHVHSAGWATRQESRAAVVGLLMLGLATGAAWLAGRLPAPSFLGERSWALPAFLGTLVGLLVISVSPDLCRRGRRPEAGAFVFDAEGVRATLVAGVEHRLGWDDLTGYSLADEGTVRIDTRYGQSQVALESLEHAVAEPPASLLVPTATEDVRVRLASLLDQRGVARRD